MGFLSPDNEDAEPEPEPEPEPEFEDDGGAPPEPDVDEVALGGFEPFLGLVGGVATPVNCPSLEMKPRRLLTRIQDAQGMMVGCDDAGAEGS